MNKVKSAFQRVFKNHQTMNLVLSSSNAHWHKRNYKCHCFLLPFNPTFGGEKRQSFSFNKQSQVPKNIACYKTQADKKHEESLSNVL